MIGVVVDAGVALAWLLPSPHARAAHALVDQAEAVWATDLVPLEVAERLLGFARAGELEAADLPELLEVLHAFPVSFRLSAPFLGDALRIALQLDVPVPVALGLALAAKHGLAYVTSERDLAARLVASEPELDVRWLGDALPPGA